MKDLWTPKYKLPCGQQNSSNVCLYFPFSCFELLFLAGMGGPDTFCFVGWHRFLSSRFQIWVHPSGESTFSHTNPTDALPLWVWMDSWSMKSKEVLETSNFGLFTSRPLLGQDCLRFPCSVLSNLMANCSNSGASPTSFGRIFHSLIRFQHLEVYPASTFLHLTLCFESLYPFHHPKQFLFSVFTIHKISLCLPRRSFQSVFMKWKNKWQTEGSAEKNLLLCSSQMFVQPPGVLQNRPYFHHFLLSNRIPKVWDTSSVQTNFRSCKPSTSRQALFKK